MKKIIRLTESDLTRIVKRVIMEQDGKNFLKIVNIKKNNETYCYDLRNKDHYYESNLRGRYGDNDGYVIEKVDSCTGIIKN
jgi:hypothetical protein